MGKRLGEVILAGTLAISASNTFVYKVESPGHKDKINWGLIDKAAAIVSRTNLVKCGPRHVPLSEKVIWQGSDRVNVRESTSDSNSIYLEYANDTKVTHVLGYQITASPASNPYDNQPGLTVVFRSLGGNCNLPIASEKVREDYLQKRSEYDVSFLTGDVPSNNYYTSYFYSQQGSL